MNKVIINGIPYEAKHVRIANHQIIIDDVVVQHEFLNMKGFIKVEGKLETLTTDCNVKVQGDVTNVHAGGSVNSDRILGTYTAGDLSELEDSFLKCLIALARRILIEKNNNRKWEDSESTRSEMIAYALQESKISKEFYKTWMRAMPSELWDDLNKLVGRNYLLYP